YIFEIPAAQSAAERATSVELDRLEQCCDQLDRAIAANEMYEVAEFDYEFHLGIAEASHNRYLVDAVHRLNCGSLRLWYHSYVHLGTERINEDHRRAVEALRKR